MQKKEIKINLNSNKILKITINDKYKELLSSVEDFFNALDKLSLLKDDKKVQVGILPLLKEGSQSLIVKKFFYLTPVHKYLHKIINSRARHIWNISFILKNNNISIAEPVLFFDDFSNNMSVFISRFIDNSSNLGSIAKDSALVLSEEMTQSLVSEIVKFHQHGFVHNDLKWSNILINNDGKVTIIDLDAVKHFKHHSKVGIKKDLIRFYRFSLEVGSQKWIEDSFFPLYLNKININFINDILLQDVKKTALQEWEKHGCRKL